MDNVFKVSKDSWHFRWIIFVFAMSKFGKFLQWKTWNHHHDPLLGFYEYKTYAPHEFCQYWRHVLLWPGLQIALTLFIVGTALYNAAYIGFGVVGLNIFYFLSFVAFVFGFIALVGGIGWMIRKWAEWRANKPKSEAKESADNFVETLWTSYKKKYCPSVSYINE